MQAAIASLLLAATGAHAAVVANKSFAPSSMTVNGTSTITITLSNTGAAAATGAAFTDNLPAGVVVASPANVASTCGGTATATPGGNTVSLSGGTIPANGGSCTVTASVTSSAIGSYTNTIPAGGVTSSEGSNGAPASATLAVVTPQPVTGTAVLTWPAGAGGRLKGNGPPAIITFTLNNPNTMALTGAALTFNLEQPVLAFASPSNHSTTCGGTVTLDTVARTGTLTGATIPANGNCTIRFEIVAAQPNVYFVGGGSVTIPAGSLTDDQGISNNLITGGPTVQAGARVDKSLAPAVIATGATSTLTLTIHNFNASPLSIDFTDALPSTASGAMTVASTPNASTTCSGTLTAVAGSSSVQLSGGSLPAVAATASLPVSCTITVSVTGTNTTSSNIVLTNTIPAGTFNGVGYPATSAALTVTAAARVVKSFAPTTIAVGGISTLTIRLDNFTTSPLSPVGFTDPLPAGVTVAATPNVTNSCGGSVTAGAGASSVQLAGGTLAAAPSEGGTSSCAVTVDVVAGTTGVKTNTIPAGNWNGVPYLGGSANLTVGAPFSVSKAITYRAFGSTRLTFSGYIQTATITLTNNTTSPIAITSFTDDLTTMGTGYTVGSAPVPSTTCGGTVNAPTGSTTITMTGGTIPASGSCTITAGIYLQLGATEGFRTNTIAAGNVVTSAGSNAVSAGFGVTVLSPLLVDKSFTPATVNAGGTSTLNIVLTFRDDPGSGITVDAPMTNISGTDNLPAGLVIATPSTFSTTCTGATITAPAGGSTVGFSGATLDPGTNCAISVQVHVPPGTPSGVLSNVIPAASLTTDQGVSNTARTAGGGNFGSPAATANLTVTNTSVTINKTFNPTNVAVGTPSQLAISFVNTNPGAIQLTQAAFTDALPAGMIVATPPSATFASAGCAGTISAVAGASSVGVSNATINANATCTLRVNVVASAAGNLTNTIPAGSLTSFQSVTNASPAAATLSVSGNANLAVSKTDGVSTVAAGTATAYTVVVSNAGPHNVVGAVVTDTPPAGVTFTSWTCAASAGASCGAASGSGAINETIAINSGATVTYTVQAQIAPNHSGSIANTATVTQPALVTDADTGNNTATDTDTVVPGVVLALTKTDGSATYTPGGSATYTVTVANTGPANATQVNVSDALPAGVTLAGAVTCTPAGTASCGTVSGSTGQTSFSAVNATLPTGAGNTLSFTVPVAFAANLTASPLVNTVTATDLPSGATGSASDSNTRSASADVTVVKSGPAWVIPGGPIGYTLLVGNAGPSQADGATFSDTLPAAIGGISASCGSASGGAVCPGAVSVAGNTVSGTIPTLPPGGSVLITLGGTASAANGAPLSNTASVAPPAGTTDPAPGDSNTVVTSVRPVVGITKTVDTTVVVPASTVTYTITVTNPGPVAADGTTVTDPVPNGITAQTWTCAPSGGATCTANGVGAINDTLASFPPGSSVVYTVSATVSAAPPANITNTATATPPDGVCSPTLTFAPCSATASLPPVPQVGIAKTVDSTTVVPGSTLTYTITVSNGGVIAADGTTVDDPLPAGIASQTWTCAASGGAACSASGSGALADTLATFPAGSFVVYTVTAIVDAAPPAVISNTATAVPPMDGICTPDNTPPPCTATANVTSNPQIGLTKMADTATLVPGGTVQYTVTVSNTGPVPADGTLVDDPLPAGIQAQSWTCAANAGATCTASGSGDLVDTIASFPPGSFVTYTLTATVSANPPATVVNTASATPPAGGICTPGATPPPCTATATGSAVPQLDLSKTANSTTVAPDGTVIYTITVNNIGAAAADGTVVSDPLPAGIVGQTWTCAASGGAVCTPSGNGAINDTLTAFPPGSFVTYTATATVASAPPAAVSNTATADLAGAVCAPGNTPAPCSRTATLDSVPLIGLTKSANAASVLAGGTLVYTVTVSNAGTSSADGTTVEDPLPAGIASQTWTCSANGGASCTANGSGALSDTLASFPAGASVTYTLTAVVEAAPPATIVNTASSTPPAGGLCAPANTAPPCSDTTSTPATIPTPTLGIDKIADTGTVQPGGTVVYTVTVSNPGLVAADGASVSDPVPAGITSQTWTCSANGGASCTANGSGAIADTLATFPVGSSVTYTVTAIVAADPPAVVSNTATVDLAGATCAADSLPAPCSRTVDLASVALIGLAKSADTATLVPGGTVQYTVTVSNPGAVPADGTLVADPMPAGIDAQTWTCAANAGATCTANGSGDVNDTLASFPPGSSVVYTVTATVSAAPPPAVSNTATATPPAGSLCAPGNTPAPCSSTVTLSAVPVIGLTKSANVASVSAGGTIVYTVTVSNSGSSAADGTAVSDPLPAGIASQTWTCTANGGASCTANGSGALVDTLATFPAGASVIYTLTAVVADAPPASIVNTASSTPPAGGLCAPGGTAPPCTATTTTTTAPSTATLALSKTASTTTLAPNGSVVYTVTVNNPGPIPANGATVTDPLPAGIASQTWTCVAAAGAVCPNAAGNGALAETIATLPPGGSLTYAITATVTANPPASVTNIAGLSFPGNAICLPSGDPAPCSATAAGSVGSVGSPAQGVIAIPVSNRWTLGLLLLAVLAFAFRRQNRNALCFQKFT